MRNEPWYYGGQPTCGGCGYTEPGTRMMTWFREETLCDPCLWDLAKCGLCGDGRVAEGEQMCDECAGKPYED